MKKIISLVAVCLLTAMLLLTLTACGGGALLNKLAVLDDPTDNELPDILPKELRFNGDGSFKIIQMSDFHEWMGIEGSSALDIIEQKTLKPHLEAYIDAILSAEQPDLVVLTGDNTFCLSAFADYFYNIMGKTYARIGKIFEDRKQYWTLTFGNHDSEGPKNKADMLRELTGYKYFIGEENGDVGVKGAIASSLAYSTKDENGHTDDRYGNFSIPIYNQDGTKVAYNIFLLDSGSYNSPPPAGVPYRYIQDRQVDWYAAQAELLKKNNGGLPVPSLMFTHIPLLELQEAWQQETNPILGEVLGYSPSNVRSKIFAKMLEVGDVKGVFFGHNHSSNITCFYQKGDAKIMMGITPQAAAQEYSDTTSIMRCRKIILNENGNFITGTLASGSFSSTGAEYGKLMSYNEGIINA